MITDQQVVLLRQKLMEGKTHQAAAAASATSERSVRRWQRGALPSEKTRDGRSWRTRPDPFVDVWESELEPLLRSDPEGELSATTILEWLDERHPGRFGRSQLRTLQRRIRDHRALHGPDREVYFQQEHPPRFVAEFVDALDREDWLELVVKPDGDPMGAPAYHPRALLSVWLYGFMTNVRSCRKLEAACRDQIPYLLSGELADKKALREQIRQAMDDLAGRDRQKCINLTDRDARLMKSSQGIVPGYNAQAMVSPLDPGAGTSGMLVTAVDVVDEANDSARLVPMLEQSEDTTGARAQVTLADAGYHSGPALDECARRGLKIVMPESSRRRAQHHPYHKDRFIYDECNDSYTCPSGQTLTPVGTMRSPYGTPRRVYRASGATCQACSAFGVCTNDLLNGRALTIGPHDAVLRHHRAWMSTREARDISKRRKQLVEPVFGIIKEQQGARRFLLRGLVNVAAEWTVLATAFNLRTLWRIWRSGALGLLPRRPASQPIPRV